VVVAAVRLRRDAFHAFTVAQAQRCAQIAVRRRKRRAVQPRAVINYRTMQRRAQDVVDVCAEVRIEWIKTGRDQGVRVTSSEVRR
jgi:hypothetical protein